MRLVNLTPHEIAIYDAGTRVLLRLSPSGTVAWVETELIYLGRAKTGGPGQEPTDVPFYRAGQASRISGLPDPAVGTIYLVSRQVFEASERGDLVAAVMTDGMTSDGAVAVRGLERRSNPALSGPSLAPGNLLNTEQSPILLN